MIEKQPRIALLIDADNSPSSKIDVILAELAKVGVTNIRRAYGNWKKDGLKGWEAVLHEYAIRPVQQFDYSKGKNATDMVMIIDAMDLLYTGNFDGFALVTSDSDFTGLAMRLREEGLMVFGFGERKTPEAFRNACHRFVFVEVLRSGGSEEPEAAEQPSSGTTQATAPAEPAPRPKLPKKFVLTALEQSVDDEGWAHLGTFGNYLNKLQPDFDPRLYGYKKLSDLVRARTDLFTTEERRSPGSNQKVLYLRAK